jgi:hypothetical protein
MEEKNFCPMFSDYVRECMKHFSIVPEVNTVEFCTTEKYTDCPFYKSINKLCPVCEMLDRCPIFKHLSIKDFDKFVQVTKDYCLSEKKMACERLNIFKSGDMPPPDLMPDGSKLK